MAQKITFEEFKNILDYLEQRQPDSYSSLLLYVNEINEKGTIFKTRLDDDTKKLLLDSIVIQQTTQLLSSEQVYKLPVVRNSDWSGSEHTTSSAVSVRDRGLAGYANIEEVLDTICKAFGVTLAEDMKLAHPDIYNDLVGRVARYYEITQEEQDLSKTPYMAAKKNDSYKTYIPLYIIYEVGRVLDNYGIFEVSAEGTQPLYLMDTALGSYPKMSKSKFKAEFTRVLNLWPNATMRGYLEECYNLVESLLDFRKTIVIGFNNYKLTITEIPNDVKLHWYQSFRIANSIRYDDGSSGEVGFYSDNVSNYTQYISEYDYRSYRASYTKTVVELQPNIIKYNGFGAAYTVCSNIDYTKQQLHYQYKYSADNKKWINNSLYSLETIPGGEYRSNFFSGKLTNTKIEDLELLNSNEFKQVLYLGRREFDKLNNEYNIEFSDKDFVIMSLAPERDRYTTDISNHYQYMKLFVFRNLNTFSYDTNTETYPAEVYSSSVRNKPMETTLWCLPDGYEISDIPKSSSISNMVTTEALIKTTKPNHLFSNTEFTVDAYEILSDGTMYHTSNTTTDYNTILGTDTTLMRFANYNITNMGKLIVPKQRVDWATLESGATYPAGISSVEDFKRVYSDWYSYHISTNNPYSSVNIETDEETVEGLAEFDYIPLSMSGATSQAIAQAGLVDEYNFDIIIKDIEDAEDDTNNDETDNKPKMNIGNTPDIPDAGDLLDVIGNGLIKQYYLTAGDLQGLHDGLFGISLASVVSNIFGNPLDMIMNFQLTYLPIQPGASEVVKVGPWELDKGDGNMFTANVVSSQYVFMNFGSVDLNPYFDNYTDYTNTTGTLYLPGCGSCNIDLAEFMKGKMKLVATADTLTGSIVYFIQSLRDDTVQTLYTFNGQVNANIPLSGSNYGRMVGDLLKNGVSAGVAIATHTPAIKTTTEAGGTILNTHDNTTAEGAHNVGESLKEYGSKQTISTGEKPGISLPQATNLNVSRGSLSANNSIVAPKVPYLVIKRNAEYNPTNISKLSGLASNNYIKLGNVSGLVKVKECHVQGLNATQEEKAKIDSLLKCGIII